MHSLQPHSYFKYRRDDFTINEKLKDQNPKAISIIFHHKQLNYTKIQVKDKVGFQPLGHDLYTEK